MQYDFVNVDNIMEQLEVDPIQLHLLFLLYHRPDGAASSAQLERFRGQVMEFENQDSLRARIDDLELKGLLENIGSGNEEGFRTKKYNTDFLIPTPKFVDVVILESAGEELWSKYPPAFPLSEGHFLARTGDKDSIILSYNRKIKKDVKKHRYIMQMLEVFIGMVAGQKINGVKIENFIKAELWDTIKEISDENITITDHGLSI